MTFCKPMSVRFDKKLWLEIKRWAKENSLTDGAAIRFLINESLKAKGFVASQPDATN